MSLKSKVKRTGWLEIFGKVACRPKTSGKNFENDTKSKRISNPTLSPKPIKKQAQRFVERQPSLTTLRMPNPKLKHQHLFFEEKRIL
mmetsp:Transcript_106044/g.306723  ORF Transcript_106044/g.306723 Transcript_106044/m.306723 type:complete len:87 (+) Transcript_106044:738-998(+)